MVLVHALVVLVHALVVPLILVYTTAGLWNRMYFFYLKKYIAECPKPR